MRSPVLSRNGSWIYAIYVIFAISAISDISAMYIYNNIFVISAISVIYAIYVISVISAMYIYIIRPGISASVSASLALRQHGNYGKLLINMIPNLLL